MFESKMICESCRTNKGVDACPMCKAGVCSRCTVELPAGAFQWLEPRPSEFAHLEYCPRCFSDAVEPALLSYQETAEKAREVLVFFVSQRKGIPVTKKGREVLKVDGQEDRDETILKLAFQAAKLGYNAIVEADVRSEKKRHAGWQTSVWTGTAFPAQVDEARMNKRWD